MALSGTVNSSGYEGRYVQLTWSATQSVANNNSTISWELKGAGQGQAGWYMSGGFYVEIAGNVVCNWSTDTRIKLYNGTSIASGSLTIGHNDDGSRSFSVNIQAGIYTYARNCSGSGSFALNTIARASQPSCITFPNNTQNVGDIGGSFYIHMNKKANFKHTVRYVWGNLSDTIATNVVDNVQWTIPLNFANQIPNSTSGYGTIYVDTYNGSTKIGTKSCRFDATVPASMKPTIKSASVEVDNSANSVIKEWGLYVAGYSKVKVSATANGSYGSTVSSFTISGGYSTTQSGASLSYTGDKLTSSGDKSFTVVAKDSRGRSSDSKSAGNITVYAYSKPSISAFSVQRGSTSKKIVVNANWSFSSVNGKNSVTATLFYKQSTSNSWSTYGTITKGESITLDTEFAEEHSYNFKLVVRDAVGNSVQIESFISTIDVLLDFRAGGKGLGIGKIAESDAMEVNMDAIFMKGIYVYDDKGNAITLENYIKSLIK